MKHKIVEQAVRWLEKMGIEVEHNEELQQFEFEYKGAFVIIDANPPTPRDVFQSLAHIYSLTKRRVRIKRFSRRPNNGGLNIPTQITAFVKW